MMDTIDEIVSVATELRRLAEKASEAPWIASDDNEPRRVCTGNLRTYGNIILGHDAAGRSAPLLGGDAFFVAYARNNAAALCDAVTMLAQSARVNADAAQELARLNDVLRTVAHHGAVLTLDDGSTVVRGRPWIDAPTHEGFWWMQRPGSEPTVVSVKFFTVGETRYVHSADTQGNFGTVHVAARWQAIDTPCGEVAP
jgi:hypothetical protein